MEITKAKLLEQISVAEKARQEALERLGFYNGALAAFRSLLAITEKEPEKEPELEPGPVAPGEPGEIAQ